MHNEDFVKGPQALFTNFLKKKCDITSLFFFDSANEFKQ